MKIINIEELPSTNQFLHEYIRKNDFEECLCVKVLFQTKGRGQQGNGWESEYGKNLTFSIVLCPKFMLAADQFILSQIVSLAIKQTLNQYIDNVTIKWPNDIYWKNKKIAGILIENSIMGQNIEHSVIGIGLNVNQEHFVSDAPNPVSTFNILGKSLDVDVLMSKIFSNLLLLYKELSEDTGDRIRKIYMDSLYRLNGYFSFSDASGRFDAKIEQVMTDGRLCLITDKGEKRFYYFKEVAFEA
jgi:BirA family biotin operon repressor/biotin-[acetyl-CoA-carboxylase] ligase